MRNRWFALATLESARVLWSPRWALAAVVWLVVAWDSANPFERNAAMYGATEWSGWDVHAAALNTFFGVVLLLMPAFVILVADGVARDRANRYAHVVIARCGWKSSWWLAKVAAILVAALVFQGGFLLTCLSVAALKGATVSPATTSAGRFDFERDNGAADMEVHPAYPPVHRVENMVARQTSRGLYLALAFAALATLMTALSVRVSYVWFPSAGVIALALADWLLNWAFKQSYFVISPLSRLAEASHSPVFVDRPFTWASSIVLYGVVATVGVTLGWWYVTRVDL